MVTNLFDRENLWLVAAAVDFVQKVRPIWDWAVFHSNLYFDQRPSEIPFESYVILK